eukprot:CAMPEP_0170536128 /NCGR_PEP_ID=MMETSP0209-20121228/101976_1 /TAXON_ID=665100 ORGANISM="Litonotus pictus, Strain P1" /NCGR_SAMPLE_ID=MMETSP0209 /ASSEMBLY_ACC=CAM_ASM_000301 /LENGTH=2016 /DNA_ID=CAMNT_0010837461 /DNA_START=1377 /DNA_END=7427 /DNA_ORIENTATION=+
MNNDRDQWIACVGDTTGDICKATVFVVENTGNFSLLKDDTDTILSEFTSSSNTSFELAWFKSGIADNAATSVFKNYWAIDLDKDDAPVNGVHRFYFPTTYTNLNSPTSDSQVHWKSDVSVKKTAVTGVSFADYYAETLTSNAEHINTAKGLIKRDDNILELKNYSGSDLTVGLFYNFYYTYNTADSNARVTDGTMVTNAATKTKNYLKFDTVKIRYNDPTSIFDGFDFLHAFYTGTGSGQPTRMNRFISLMPQYGVFVLKSEEIDNSSAFVQSLIFDDDSSDDASRICILDVNLASMADLAGSNVVLNLFMPYVGLLDYEKTYDYPISGTTAWASDSQLIEPALAFNSGNKHNDADTMTFDKYLYTRLEINVTTNSLARTFIPINCYKKTTSYEYIQAFKAKKSSSKYSLPALFSTNSINNSLNADLSLDASATWTYLDNGKFNMNISQGTDLLPDNPQSRYIGILSDYGLNSSSLKILNLGKNLENPSFPTSSTDSTTLLLSYTDNKLTIDSKTLSNGLFLYKLSNSGDPNLTFTKTATTNHAEANIYGIDFPEDNAIDNLTDNNLYVVYHFESTKDYVCEMSSISFDPNSPITDNTLKSLVSISIFTSGIKTPVEDKANNYICGTISVNMKKDTNKAKVFTPNLTDNSVFETANFEGTIDNQSSYVEVVSSSSNESKLTFHVCNLRVKDDTPFTVESVELYSGSKLFYRSNDEIVSVAPSINTANYKSNTVSSYKYDTDKGAYSLMTLSLTLDHEVFRKMRLEVTSDILSTLLVDDRIETKCQAKFRGIAEGGKNKIFETCYFDNSGGSIVVTTVPKVMFDSNLDKNIEILIWPINAKKLSDSTFNVITSFNPDTSSIFPGEDASPTAASTLSTIEPCSLTASAVNILPDVPGFTGKIEFQINETTSDTLSNCLTTQENPVLNEMAIYFPSAKYSSIDTSSLKCYYNSSEVTNCVSENDWIYLRTGISFSDLVKVEIYGFEVMLGDYIPSTEDSKFLIKVNTLTEHTRKVWVQGKGKIADNFNRAPYVAPSSDFKYNLAVINQTYYNTAPNTVSDIDLELVVDDLKGLNSGDFLISTILDSFIYIQVPRNIILSANSDIKIRHLAKPEIDSRETEDISVDYTLEELQVYGRMISAKITSDLQLNNRLRKIIVTVSNINTPVSNAMYDNMRAGIYDILIKRENLYMKTFASLLTYNTGDTDKLSTGYNMIKNNRGVLFSYATGKFYFDYTNNFKIKPGAYTTLTVSVKELGTIKDLTKSTEISIGSSDFFTPKGSKYEVNGQFKNQALMMIGMNCGAIPGRYYLSLQHSDSNSGYFSLMAPLWVNVEYSYLKETVRFYDSENKEYKTSSPFSLGMGGYINFWAMTSLPSVTDITVSFSIDSDTTTTVTAPKALKLVQASSEKVIGIFSSPNINIKTKQKYIVSVSGNSCFSSSPSTIEFHPSIEIEQIPTDLKLVNMISFQSEIGNSSNNLKRNQLKFTYDGKALVLPSSSDLFCSLTCFKRSPPSDTFLSTLPFQPNNWYESYFHANIEANQAYSNIYDSLVRDIKYKLKCLLKTTHVQEDSSSKASVIVESIEDVIIEPKQTQELKCIEVNVQKKESDFDAEAHKIIQDAFFEDFENQGCVVVLNEENLTLPNFDLVSYKCPLREDQETDTTTSVEVSDTSVSTSDTTATDSSLDTSADTNTDTNTLRYLQTTTTTDTTQTTDSSGTDTTDPVVNLTQSFKYCLKQSMICPNDVDIAKLDATLKDLFDDTQVVSSRILQSTTKTSKFKQSLSNTTLKDLFDDTQVVSSRILQSTTKTSKFKQSLSNNLKTNYISYKIIIPESDFTIDYTTITASDLSDFEIKSEMVNFKVDIQSSNTDTFHCSWALNDIPQNSNTPPTADQLIECDLTMNTICSEEDGIKIPSGKTTLDETVRSSKFIKGKTYTLWLTCRQDIIIARSYTTPNVVATIEADLDDPYACPNGRLCPTNTPCNGDNPLFPGCCPNGVDPEFSTLCANCKWISTVGLLLALLAFIF